MFELTYEQIRNRSFLAGMGKIVSHGMTDHKAAYDVVKVSKRIEREGKVADATFKKLVKGYGTIDEKKGSFDIPDEKVLDWKVASDDFLAQKFKVEWKKIRMDTIEGVPLSPSEIEALHPLLDGLD